MSGPGGALDLARWKERLNTARDVAAASDDGGRALALLVDDLVRDLARPAGWQQMGRAVVAQGGYGRGELAPRSDLDLLFLARRVSDAGEMEEVLYPLWDLGFEVGHALRTPADCASLASAELTAATALLDARLLLGDSGLLEAARRRAGIRPGGSKEMRRWVPRILEDLEVRRLRFGEVSHLLEPHVKEGRGGLRDLQACRWILQCLGKDPREGTREAAPRIDVAWAERTLSRVRGVLHVVAGRKTDHLTFEFHREVAEQILPGSPMEAFFEILHRAGHCIVGTWEGVSAAAQEELLPPRKRSLIQEPLRSAELIVTETLAWCRSGGRIPDELRRTLTHGDPRLLQSAIRAAAARILRTRLPLAPLLHELHHLGRLDLIAPELEAVAHQVHYDARHAFTTGVHCIETLRVFEELWMGVYERSEPHLTRIAGAVLSPVVVRVAALCHDLGKVEGATGHAQAGADIALHVASRMGLDAEEAAEVARLVEVHEKVPAVAFGGDLEDPASWNEVRGAAGSASGVDALVALAFADLMATNPSTWAGMWSDWKRDLLITLHSRAQDSVGHDLTGSGRLRRAVEAAARETGLTGVGGLWDRVPPRELLQVPPDLLAHLFAMAQELGDEPARWVVEPRRPGLADILGVTQPLPRLLSSTTGALARLGLSILSFQAHTWDDGTVHLWLRVAHRQAIPGAEEVSRALTSSVTGESRPRARVSPALPDRRSEAVPVPIRVRLAPGENPFFSILEVRCRDRRGLIRDLARLFEDLGLTVEYALVTTHGPMAQDVFHLKDIFGGRVEGAGKLESLAKGVEAIAAAGFVRDGRGQDQSDAGLHRGDLT